MRAAPCDTRSPIAIANAICFSRKFAPPGEEVQPCGLWKDSHDLVAPMGLFHTGPVTAIAGQLDAVPSLFAIPAAILAIRRRVAFAGSMSALLSFRHG